MPSPPPTVAPPLELLTELTRRLPQRDDQRFDALTAAQSFGLFLVAGFLVGIMLSCAVSVPSALLGSAVEDLLGVPRVVVTATLIGLVWLASVAAPFLTLYYWSAFKLAPGDHHARDLLVQLLGRLLPHATPGAEATLTLSPFDPSRPDEWSWTLTVPLRSNRASLRCVGRGDASSRSLKATWSGSHRTLFEQLWTSEGAGGASSGDTTDDPAVVMADALLRGLNLPSEATLLDADHALTLTDARPQVTGDPIAPFTLTATTPLDHAVEVAPPLPVSGADVAFFVAVVGVLVTLHAVAATGWREVLVLGEEDALYSIAWIAGFGLVGLGTVLKKRFPQGIHLKALLPRGLPRAEADPNAQQVRFDGQRLGLFGVTSSHIDLERDFTLHLSRDPDRGPGDTLPLTLELVQPQEGGGAPHRLRVQTSVRDGEAVQRLPLLDVEAPHIAPRDVAERLWPLIAQRAAAFGPLPRHDLGGR